MPPVRAHLQQHRDKTQSRKHLSDSGVLREYGPVLGALTALQEHPNNFAVSSE